MTESWRWDDPDIPSDESLLRRIPAKPDYCVHLDSITDKPYATPRALRIDRDSGMSVHFERLLEERHDVVRETYYPDDYLISFTPAAVQTMEADPWGVVEEEDPDDPLYGRAHGEVRHRTQRPSKSQREAVREAINRACIWIRAADKS